jgi:Calx-beta domain/Beta-propeller repeat
MKPCFASFRVNSWIGFASLSVQSFHSMKQSLIPNHNRSFVVGLLLLVVIGLPSLTFRSSHFRNATSSRAQDSSKPPSSTGSLAKDRDRIDQLIANLPLTFEPNTGQIDSHVKFLARGPGSELMLQSSEVILRLAPSGSLLTCTFIGANPAAVPSGVDPLPGHRNYLLGNDPSKWRRDVPLFQKVVYSKIYPGINLTYYGKRGEVEYDFDIAPNADPRAIRLGFGPHVKPTLSANGDLIVRSRGVQIIERKPVIYQEIDGRRRPIEGRYALLRNGEVGFDIGEYDRAQPLVIDPTIIYSTFLGGSSSDFGSSVAVDASNNVYVTGTTASANFPVHGAAFPNKAGLDDIFVVKIDSTGRNILYSTYIGGSGLDRADGIAIDGNGNAYVAGRVGDTSTDFPTTAGSLAPSYRGGDFDGIVFKLNPQGNGLVYSTYLGGEDNDSTEGVAVDSAGNAYLTGGTRSSGFPVTSSAFQSFRAGDTDAYMTKLNPAGSAVLYSTLLGGGSTDRGSHVVVDAAGNVYLAGYSASPDFPTENAFQGFSGGGFDCFIARLDTAKNGADSLVFSTYLGGVGDDKAYGIAIDNQSANLYIAGQTSSPDFPVLNPAQPAIGGLFDAFVAKISSSGAKIYATYLGGAGDDRATGIAVNSASAAYVTGFTSSTNFPTVTPLQLSNGGGFDAFLAKLNASGNAFLYSTYLGGSANESNVSAVTSTNPLALDASSNAYLTGFTSSTNFPTASPLQPANAGGLDAFVVKIADAAPTSTVQFNSPTYSIQEDCTFVNLTVNRTGDTSGTAKVDYSTLDATATARRDYITVVGTLSFAPGETSRTIAVLINEDSYVEGNETFTVNLSNPSGVSLGASVATVTIVDDPTEPLTNPIDDPSTFVCQQYHDFLNRQADASGQAFWTNEITSCGMGQACIDVKRVNTSGAFFLSIEFQQTGYLVERLYKAAYGDANGTSTLGGAHQITLPTVRFNEFLPDTQQIGQGVVVGQAGWETILESNKQAFATQFVQRSRFAAAFPTSMTPAQFVDKLNQNAGNVLSAGERTLAMNFFGGAADTTNSMARAQALRQVADDPDLVNAEFNRAFVLMEYFSYLRRNPNDAPDADYTGYDFWLTKLNQFNGNYIGAEMVKAFITSIEYRQRFGP